jgi:hypothetical protein
MSDEEDQFLQYMPPTHKHRYTGKYLKDDLHEPYNDTCRQEYTSGSIPLLDLENSYITNTTESALKSCRLIQADVKFFLDDHYLKLNLPTVTIESNTFKKGHEHEQLDGRHVKEHKYEKLDGKHVKAVATELLSLNRILPSDYVDLMDDFIEIARKQHTQMTDCETPTRVPFLYELKIFLKAAHNNIKSSSCIHGKYTLIRMEITVGEYTVTVFTLETLDAENLVIGIDLCCRFIAPGTVALYNKNYKFDKTDMYDLADGVEYNLPKVMQCKRPSIQCFHKRLLSQYPSSSHLVYANDWMCMQDSRYVKDRKPNELIVFGIGNVRYITPDPTKVHWVMHYSHDGKITYS